MTPHRPPTPLPPAPLLAPPPRPPPDPLAPTPPCPHPRPHPPRHGDPMPSPEHPHHPHRGHGPGPRPRPLPSSLFLSLTSSTALASQKHSLLSPNYTHTTNQTSPHKTPTLPTRTPPHPRHSLPLNPAPAPHATTSLSTLKPLHTHTTQPVRQGTGRFNNTLGRHSSHSQSHRRIPKSHHHQCFQFLSYILDRFFPPRVVWTKLAIYASQQKSFLLTVSETLKERAGRNGRGKLEKSLLPLPFHWFSIPFAVGLWGAVWWVCL